MNYTEMRESATNEKLFKVAKRKSQDRKDQGKEEKKLI